MHLVLAESLDCGQLLLEPWPGRLVCLKYEQPSSSNDSDDPPSATSLAVGKSLDRPTGARFPSAATGLHAALAADALIPCPDPIVGVGMVVVVKTLALIGAG